MDHGLYTAYLGMKARERALDVMANNIANASTPGFKADRLAYRSAEESAIQEQLPGGASGKPAVRLASFAPNTMDPSFSITHGRMVGLVNLTKIDFSNGQIRQTGNALDVALDGDGFLAVQTERGERYTRAGALKLNTTGQLTTSNGDLVLGETGPITLKNGNVSIGAYGDITVDGNIAGKLKIVKFDNPSSTLIKEGNSLFAAPNAKPAVDSSTHVVQHALEMSNVDAVTEMAAMIKNSREFDSLQRSVTMLMNDLGRKVSDEIGRI